MFAELLARLRALYLYYQTAHWQSKSPLFYGDHLLFDRLYNAVVAEVDAVAENAIAATQDVSVVNLNESLKLIAATAVKLPTENKENATYFNAALMLELDLLKFLEDAEKQDFSLGTRNMLAGLAEAHQGYVYLLRQRLSK